MNHNALNLIAIPTSKLNNKDIVEALKRIKRLGCNAMIVLDRSEMTNHFTNIGIIDTCEEDIEESQVRRFCTIATQAQIKKIKSL